MDPISTALIAAGAKVTAGPVFALVKDLGRDVYNDWAAQFQSSFQGHVDATKARCSRMKNILYRDQSVDFESQYVNINFTFREDIITDVDALTLANSGEYGLVYGTAGAGKTMFMRWSALHLIEHMSTYGRIPLYLEMRYFDTSYEDRPFDEYVYAKTASSTGQANLDQFRRGLQAGVFFVLLDAVDEIPPTCRDRVVGKILDFIAHFPKTGILLSSRFDEKLESIQELSVFRSMPMNMGQITSVIERLEYDIVVKDKLISRLIDGLYEELEEFLSNPLLATIMLLTFDHSADIPTKLTSFYQQAFEALYQRHDSAKGAYKRNHHAGLPLDQFQALFSAFSFQTYLDYKFEFSDDELLSAFREACLTPARALTLR